MGRGVLGEGLGVARVVVAVGGYKVKLTGWRQNDLLAAKFLFVSRRHFMLFTHQVPNSFKEMPAQTCTLLRQ